jgi:hypothetical protein
MKIRIQYPCRRRESHCPIPICNISLEGDKDIGKPKVEDTHIKGTKVPRCPQTQSLRLLLLLRWRVINHCYFYVFMVYGQGEPFHPLHFRYLHFRMKGVFEWNKNALIQDTIWDNSLSSAWLRKITKNEVLILFYTHTLASYSCKTAVHGRYTDYFAAANIWKTN